ncbi:LOW QUALITY PROTEIN: craniofacial development protein 2-like, partial [Bos indicus]|uniref:LOW QUALITY PROTEIN: craniofacial development protein 2-like n=1 Tax=Bos indicus TaxID=9915 RepID=A0ABM4SGB1_BOSIN
MTPNRLHIFCEVKWTPLEVGCPREDTMNLKIVEAVYTVVTGELEHPDQYPYIDSWTLTCPPPSVPPGLEADLMPKPGPGEVPAAASVISPALVEIVELPFRQAPIPAMETSGQRPQDSTSAGSPGLYPPLVGLLCENPHVTTENLHVTCHALSPATLLLVGEGGPSHDCKEILEEVYASRPDLRDQPIPDPDWVLYTKVTSLVKQEQQLSGYAVVMKETIVEASSLPSHWSAQRVKLCSNPGPPAVKRFGLLTGIGSDDSSASDLIQQVQCCKEQYCIGTWNVRSMNQGKLEVVKQEMARVNVDILGISELKWTGMGEFNSDDHYIYYCGQQSLRRNGVAIMVNKRVRNAVVGCNLKNDRMISVRFQGKPFNTTVIQAYAPTSNTEEDEFERFCEDLLELTPPKDVLFIIGDWNAKVGSQETPGVTGKFGLGMKFGMNLNESGQKLIEFCQENALVRVKENALVIASTLFQKHKRRLYTWTSPDGQHQNQIGYILCSQRWKSPIQSRKTRPGADCGSDHEFLITKFRLKFKKVGRTT